MGKGDELKLTVKQKSFADLYIETGNATDSYRKSYNAGSTSVANTEGCKLLKHPKVSTYIRTRMESKDKDKIASQDEVLEFLSSVMRGKVTEKIPLLIGNGMQELTENLPPVQVREKAAELLGKRYRLFTDRHELEATVGVKVVDDIKG